MPSASEPAPAQQSWQEPGEQRAGGHVSGESFVMSGNLESMALFDLLETIRLGRKHAHIRIECAGEHGHLWCIDGELIDAQFGALVGSSAAHQLLTLRQGRLQAGFARVYRERTIRTSTEELLIEHARRRDELERLRGELNLAQVLRVKDLSGQGPKLDPWQEEVLKAFGQGRSIGEVARTREGLELEALTAVAELSSRGALAPASPRPPLLVGRAVSRISSAPAVAVDALRHSVPVLARRYAPQLAALGVFVGFGVGFWVALSTAHHRHSTTAALAPQESTSQRTAAADARRIRGSDVARTLCGSEMALFLIGDEPASQLAPARGEPPTAYCMDRRAASTGEYLACVGDGECQALRSSPSPKANGAGQREKGRRLELCSTQGPGPGPSSTACISQEQAKQYCEWRGLRLPAPDEWQRAWRSLNAPSESDIGLRCAFGIQAAPKRPEPENQR